MNSLLEWIESPASDHGFRFLHDSGDWKFSSFATIAQRSQAVAANLLDFGIARDSVVCVFLPTGPEFVAAMFGTWIAGGSVCPLVPPMMFEDEEEYIKHVSRIIRAASPIVLVTNTSFKPLVESVVVRAGLQGSRLVDVNEIENAPVKTGQRARVALLQFTSGSSGTPRGVQVSFENLDSNIMSIRRWINMSPTEVTATWLPLYHDMGLIGCLLTPTVNQSDVWVMRPDQFIRDPLAWLECFGKRGASLCAAPNFGYGYVARKVPAQSLVGMDFSKWRIAIAGAEPVDAQALTQLSELLAPFGFSDEAYLPAYGLAEATLAVTGGSTGTPALAVKLDWDSLSFGEVVRIKGTAPLGDLQGNASAGWLVSSGKPHAGIEVVVVGDDSKELAQGVLGEIFVRGGSVALGYADTRADSATKFSKGGVLTGDAGFVLKGELFVVGRIADSLKVRGRSVYAEDLEARISLTTGLRRGRFVVIASPGESGGEILTIAEQVDDGWAKAVVRLLKGIVGDGVPIKVGTGPKGIIQRTSSGKPRRRVMWQLEQAGQLHFDEIIDA